MAKKTRVGKKLEKAAVFTGRELGALVGRVEKEARGLARRKGKMQAAARKRTAELMRRASRTLGKLAAEIE